MRRKMLDPPRYSGDMLSTSYQPKRSLNKPKIKPISMLLACLCLIFTVFAVDIAKPQPSFAEHQNPPGVKCKHVHICAARAQHVTQCTHCGAASSNVSNGASRRIPHARACTPHRSSLGVPASPVRGTQPAAASQQARPRLARLPAAAPVRFARLSFSR